MERFPGQVEGITVIMEVGGESLAQLDDLNIWDIRDGEYKWRYKLGRSSELVSQGEPVINSDILFSDDNSIQNQLSKLYLSVSLHQISPIWPCDRCEDLIIIPSHDGSSVRPSCFGTLWILSSIILCKIFVLNYSDFDYRPGLNSDNPRKIRASREERRGWDGWLDVWKLDFVNFFNIYQAMSLSPSLYLCRISDVSGKKWNQMATWPGQVTECEKIRIGNIFINHCDGRGQAGPGWAPLEHSNILLTTSQSDTARALRLTLRGKQLSDFSKCFLPIIK